MGILSKTKKKYGTFAAVVPEPVDVNTIAETMNRPDTNNVDAPTVSEAARAIYAMSAEPVAIKPPDAREPLPVKVADDQGVERLNLGKATDKALMRAGFDTIGDLRDVGDGYDWTQHAGIGATGAEKIKAALATYADVPEAEPETSTAAFPVFESLIFIEDELDLVGLADHKFIMSGRLFEGIGEQAIIEGLRTLAEHKRVIVEVHTDHVETVMKFAATYGVPFVHRVRF